jgi:hypothetical protein
MADKTTAELDQEGIAAIQSVYVNRFYMGGFGVVSRLTFGEQQVVNGPTTMRASVTMTTENLVALRDLLIDLTKDVQAVEVPASPANAK